MRYILFDLDGTLTDPALGITNAVRYALERYRIYPATREELYPYIGPPLIDSFQQLAGLTTDEARQALIDYREYFADRGLFENMVYPGMAGFLQALIDDGYTLLVATSKPEEYAGQILRHFGLDRYFAAVVGNTLDEARPKKSDVIAHLRRLYPDLTADNALMIGDRRYDIEGARAEGLRAVGVLYGYGSEQELRAASPAALAADLPQLSAVIRRLLPADECHDPFTKP